MKLRPASADEQRARDVVTFEQWGTRLTLPQYLEREAALREHPWARERMTTWLLADGAGVLASCETFRNDSSVGAAAGSSWSVASVFTEPDKRGKGYAAQLMKALVARLREEPAAHSSVLFSDVGAPIYEKSGYRAVPAFDWVLPPGDFALEAQWLEAPTPAPPRGTALPGQLLLHPSALQLDWHHARSRLYARFLGVPALEHYGARTSAGAIWWTAQFKSNELLVLWLDAADAASATPLLRAAQLQAHRAGLPKVRVWETFSLAKVPGAARTERDAELPMVVGLNVEIHEWARVERALWV